MSSNYQYSIKVNEALEKFGAKTYGTLPRRVERLKRFTEMKNAQYAEELRQEHTRMVANEEREQRIQRRENAPVFLRRNLKKAAAPHYNLRSHRGLDLLCEAIQNEFVNTNRG